MIQVLKLRMKVMYTGKKTSKLKKRDSVISFHMSNSF